MNHPTRSPLPGGVVTFMFTDIEGSTQLVHELGDDYADVLNAHRVLLRESFANNGGIEVVTTGDGFFVAFVDPKDALRAAVDAQRALGDRTWPRSATVGVRMGLHTGHPTLVDGDYVGLDVHRASRIADSAHGGQIVMSEVTRRLLGAGVEATDLGLHRLKGLDDPEHIFQVVAQDLRRDFPRLRSLTAPTNIPASLDPIVGREREVQDLRTLLTEGARRLITIHGPGGAGKTRLAAEVALSVLDDFIGGVFFVDLTTTSAAGIEMAIADVIDRELGVEPNELAITIGDKRVLLILDNFEQAVEGAGSVGDLIGRCPGLSVLATSQVVLRVSGESEYPLAPLALPADRSVASVLASAAAQLFIRRAAAARPDFEASPDNAPAIAEICRLLDGLPLALELAAARTRLLTVDEIVVRLGDGLRLLTGGARDAPSRHRTLRATIDWSYELLSPVLKTFFRDFAVFEGGADLRAVEMIIEDHDDPLEALTSLVEHSLIRQRDVQGKPRFYMLQTLRAYALELLDASPDHELLRERHATFYLELVETGADDRDHALDREMDNFRRALDWWLGKAESHEGAGTSALRLATALGSFWYRHGHAVEGITWFERALAAATDPPVELHAGALRGLGVLVESSGDLERARALFEEALARFRAAGSPAGEAAALNSLGVVMRALGDLDTAERFFENAIDLRRAIGDQAGLSAATSNLGITAIDRGDYERARTLLETALDLDRKLDDGWAVAVDSSNLAVVHLESGDHAGAMIQTSHALIGFSDHGDLDGIATALEITAGVAAATSAPAEAARLGGAADASRAAAGLPMSPPDRARFESWMAGPRAALSHEDFERSWQEGAAMTVQQATDYALRLTRS